jgi:fructose-specific phosphotransferase system IIA component
MKITDFLDVKAATADLKSQSKEEVISELVDIVIETGGLDKKDKDKVMEILMAREALGSTAIGQGIAIPHGKSDNVKKLVGSIGISKQGLNFDSLDGEPVYIFFLLIAPVDSAGPHLKALARISRLLKDKYIRDNLRNATSGEDIIQLIKQEDGLAAM